MAVNGERRFFFCLQSEERLTDLTDQPNLDPLVQNKGRPHPKPGNSGLMQLN